jgi:4-aminobutyrate aminotransferase-like enzyme
MKPKKPVVPADPESARYWKRFRELMPKYFWSDKTRQTNIVIAGARGSTLVDVDGREYIDLTSQWSTNNLGNVHPEVFDATVKALEQYGFLIYSMNAHVPMIDLAEKLLEVRPSDNLTRVFLELSGTGAAEGAIKHAVEASRRPLVLSFIGQYHGLSIGASAISSLDASERRYWEAFSGGALHAPYPFPYRRPTGMTEADYGEWALGYIEDVILRHVAAPDRIAGAIFEPVACEAGIWIPPANFVRGLRDLCTEHGWFFIDDEVEAGLGRTGKMWAIEHYGVAPDLMSIGKGISGGLMPISAVLGSERAMGVTETAAGTTFGGHPAACVAAIATLEIMRRDRIPERSARLGSSALKRAKEWESLDGVGEVRGLGLCIGVEFVQEKTSKVRDLETTRRVFFECVERGVIPLYAYDDNVLRIQPPLTIEEELLNRALDTLEESLRKHARKLRR